MTESTDLAIRSIGDVVEIAKLFSESRLFKDAQQMQQAAVKILAGRELGLSPVAAMRGLHVIDGKIELSGTQIAAMIKRSDRYDYRVTEHTNERCSITFVDLDQSEDLGSITWAVEDALRAGLCTLKDGKPYARSQSGKKLPWETYTRAMLFNRAIAEGARTHCPDVFDGPIYSDGELPRDDDESGLPATPPAPKPAQQETSQPTDPTTSETEVVDGELVEEGAEEQPPDQTPAAVEAEVTGESEAEPASSSDDVSAGEAHEDPPADTNPADGTSPAEAIEALRLRIGDRFKKPTALLIWLRKPGHLGRDAIKQAKWEQLSPDDGAKAVELLTAVAEGKHECGPACEGDA